MIIDKRTEFFDALTIPAAGTAALGDVVDLGIPGRDIGNGDTVYWYGTVDVAGVGGTSVTLNLVSSAAAALTSPNIHASTGAILLASLTLGKVLFMISLPVEGVPYLRYLGVQGVTVGTFSAGQISSGLTLDPKGWKPYADGVN